MHEDNRQGPYDGPPNPPFILFWCLWLLWLIFFVPPVADAVVHPSLRNGLLILGAVVCTVCYVWSTWDNTRHLRRPLGAPEVTISRLWWGQVGTLIVLGMVMGGVGGVGWLEPHIFAVAVISGRLKTRQLVWAMVGMEALNAILTLGILRNGNAFLQGVFLMPAVAIAVSNLVSASETNRALRLARQEITRLAVNEERLRFARDLHDLLGHTLSLIAIKSELAGQLVAEDPAAARGEIAEIESAARTALADVRAAVAGYRQPTLASEIAGARELLAAAGIAVTVERSPVVLPTPVEALFAWAVREGVTNVLRHSRARHCAIAITSDDEAYALSITDDGRGGLSANGDGNGLRGLAERANILGGTATAEPMPSGGFGLRVVVPRVAEVDAVPMEVGR